jgi:hypothetical protein
MIGDPELLPRVVKVVPSGVTFDAAACVVEFRVVVDGEEQVLFARSVPPLMDGAVVLRLSSRNTVLGFRPMISAILAGGYFLLLRVAMVECF